LENERDYVVTAEDLPVPDELLRSLPPHLPWSRLLSPEGLEWRIRKAEILRAAAVGEVGGGGRRGWWRKGASGGAGADC
jgi:hypothetical protein